MLVSQILFVVFIFYIFMKFAIFNEHQFSTKKVFLIFFSQQNKVSLVRKFNPTKLLVTWLFKLLLDGY